MHSSTREYRGLYVNEHSWNPQLPLPASPSGIASASASFTGDCTRLKDVCAAERFVRGVYDQLQLVPTSTAMRGLTNFKNRNATCHLYSHAANFPLP